MHSVQALPGDGARADERSSEFGMTPLMHAAAKGKSNVVGFLLTCEGAAAARGGAPASVRGGGGRQL